MKKPNAPGDVPHPPTTGGADPAADHAPRIADDTIETVDGDDTARGREDRPAPEIGDREVREIVALRIVTGRSAALSRWLILRKIPMNLITTGGGIEARGRNARIILVRNGNLQVLSMILTAFLQKKDSV